MFGLWPRGSARSFARLLDSVVVGAAVMGALLVASGPAAAIETEGNRCLDSVGGSISASPAIVTVGQSTTLSWNATARNCRVRLSVTAVGLGPIGVLSGSSSLVAIGDANGNATYELRAVAVEGSKSLDRVTVKVNPPTPVYGRTTLRIDWNAQVEDFVRAIATPNTTVLLADDLNLDLTGRHDLAIATGVHIIGGRSTTNPGPRLFTTDLDLDGPLFAIGEYQDADGVRISGVRIDGGEMGIHGGGIFQDNDPVPVGIMVNSSVNVEIANSEIYGWSGVAVRVRDTRHRINLGNASAVWIHDNNIHHNQRRRHLGYGVQTKEGAYALIERNVFDNNRHSLESAGDIATGYRAYKNLQLQNGGENSIVNYTHMFDVHGTLDCDGKDAYCGPAGQYFDYRYNTLLYTKGDVIKVRGFPALGAQVTKNVFLKAEGSGAISQTDGDNLIARDNRFGANKDSMYANYACDFDGDGYKDHFMANGVTWWWQPNSMSPQRAEAFYLNTSSKMVGDLSFGDFNGDGRCDVKVNADGSVYHGGRGNPVGSSGVPVAAKRTDLVLAKPFVSGQGGTAHWWQLDSGLQGFTADVEVHLRRYVEAQIVTSGKLVGTGDFNGDGATDLLWRDMSPVGEVLVTLLDAAGRVVVPGPQVPLAGFAGGTSSVRGTVLPSMELAGIGDFNGDGRSDILWRRDDGQLLLWFAGESGNSALVNWGNDLDVDENGIGRPKDAPVPVEWKVKGVGDFNGDGFSDILWRHDNGQVAIWYMVHAMHVGEAGSLGIDPNHVWEIQGVGDFNGDGKSDILWRGTDGQLVIWGEGLYEAGRPTFQNSPGWVAPPEWQIRAVGDFNADGFADILWRRTDGTLHIWKMNGVSYIGGSALLSIDNTYQLHGLLAQAPQRIELQ
jgi:hypothetical protein